LEVMGKWHPTLEGNCIITKEAHTKTFSATITRKTFSMQALGLQQIRKL
jgi:hypothetical protein